MGTMVAAFPKKFKGAKMSEKQQRDLPERMLALANKNKLSSDHEMREAAEHLKMACKAYFKEEPEISVFKFAGYYARARRLWCEYTGEPLIG
jgi:hypothetical protein